VPEAEIVSHWCLACGAVSKCDSTSSITIGVL
jgi:hypothetical protein